MTNRLREAAANGTAFGAWCTIPSGAVTEQLALTDLDYVCIDCQHGLVDYADMLVMLQAMARTNVTSVVRVVSHDHATIGKVLDAGADAVIVPMVNDRAQAEYVASACRYAPTRHPQLRTGAGGRNSRIGGDGGARCARAVSRDDRDRRGRGERGRDLLDTRDRRRLHRSCGSRDQPRRTSRRADPRAGTPKRSSTCWIDATRTGSFPPSIPTTA